MYVVTRVTVFIDTEPFPNTSHVLEHTIISFKQPTTLNVFGSRSSIRIGQRNFQPTKWILALSLPNSKEIGKEFCIGKYNKSKIIKLIKGVQETGRSSQRTFHRTLFDEVIFSIDYLWPKSVNILDAMLSSWRTLSKSFSLLRDVGKVRT